ncbi:hypothetical protein [Bordetella bronchialis]|uniref:hypothetical protein n=1 Tax=Bordetella bronchialis TaxID=463025 RepID=UPI000A7A88B6|nr:hypothetical protein [Bordetella bronchialis]
MDSRNRIRIAALAIALAAMLGGCAAPSAERVNGDAWKYGFSYAGPMYPDTGQ